MDVTVLLRCGWGLAIISCIVEFLPLGRLSEVARDFSRRGKLKLSPSPEKPPRFTVPQSWFIHFYVLGTMVNTALLLVVLLFAYACTFPVSARESPFSIMMAQMGGTLPVSGSPLHLF
jgi:3-oxo-5-alpha-steroid 4-dehydrogenase 3